MHVYYGCRIAEVVPEDRGHPAFKLLIGRLFNAGVKGVALRRSFSGGPQNHAALGQALQSEDPEQLVQALAGRGGQRKLTREIRAFVTGRFPEIYGQSRAGYSQRLRAEIKAVFGVTLSGECLRPLLKSLRAELRQELNEPGVAREDPKTGDGLRWSAGAALGSNPRSPGGAMARCPAGALAAGHSQGVSRFAWAGSGPSGRGFLPSSGRVAF